MLEVTKRRRRERVSESKTKVAEKVPLPVGEGIKTWDRMGTDAKKRNMLVLTGPSWKISYTHLGVESRAHKNSSAHEARQELYI